MTRYGSIKHQRVNPPCAKFNPMKVVKAATIGQQGLGSLVCQWQEMTK
jgi:hypothetical protein